MRDVAHALEREGVVSGQGRVQAGASATGRDPARGVVQLTLTNQRGRLLVAALGFAGCSMPSYDRARHELRAWLDSWSGIGHVAVGMARQGSDLQLTAL
jgi:hypothetical protein